jgi:hypothetical protein
MGGNRAAKNVEFLAAIAHNRPTKSNLISSQWILHVQLRFGMPFYHRCIRQRVAGCYHASAATAALLLQLDAIACEVSVMDMPISLFVEIPETLHQSLATFLDTRPEWDQDRVFSAAISLFLLQNRLPEQVSDRNAARIYIDALFGDSVFGHANPEFPSAVPRSLGANQVS